jgi:hypothetical protein
LAQAMSRTKAESHQQAQAILVLIAHHLHAVAAVREMQRLLGHQRLVAFLDLV